MEISAGLLMYKIENNSIFCFLVHPGGPFFVNKDKGYWGIPKGLVDKKDQDNLINTAKREFNEETGLIPSNELIALGNTLQKNKKIVYAWGFEGMLPDNYVLKSNLFEIEWPLKFGIKTKFPEIDKGEFFKFKDALEIIKPEHCIFLERLLKYIEQNKF